MAGTLGPEMSRPVSPERLGEAPYETRVVASEAERAALAARLGLLELVRLEARLTLRRGAPGARLRLEGHLEAEVVQACVVSLEPVAGTIEADFVQVYQLEPPLEASALEAPSGAAPEVTVGPGSEDEDPEPLEGGELDLGEAVAQELALALDPYPRAPGTRVPEAYRAEDQGEGEAGRHRPFAALKALKPRPPG